MSAPAEDDDAALVADIVAGHTARFADLYRRHAGPVFARLLRLVGPVPEREDLMQQIFVEVHHALPSFRGEARFSTFLYRIVVRVAARHLERRRRQPIAFSDADLELLLGAGRPHPAEARDEIVRAMDLLARLKPKKRVAFVLSVVEELSYAEIAALVGAREDAVKQRVLAARRELQAMLDREDRR